MSQVSAANGERRDRQDGPRDAQRLLQRARGGRPVLRVGGLLQRGLQQPLGPRELQREDRQADRDHHERRARAGPASRSRSAGSRCRRRRGRPVEAAALAVGLPGARAACGPASARRARGGGAPGSRRSQQLLGDALEQVGEDPGRRAPDEVVADDVDVGAERDAAAQQAPALVAVAQRRAAAARAPRRPRASLGTHAWPGSISPTNG